MASRADSNQLILLSARLRFSPQIQPIKQEAIDKLVEQAIFSTSKDMLAVKDIIQTHKALFKKAIINNQEIRDCLERLTANGRIIEKDNKYKLDGNVAKEITQLNNDAQTKLSKVFNDLFIDLEGDKKVYFDPFISCLCSLFLKLGEAYVQLMLGKKENKKFLNLPQIKTYVRSAAMKYKVDASVLKAAINQFFEESNPNFDAIKWNLAQNYYIAMTLGLDSRGQALSKDLFRATSFILDTNVLIQALEPLAPDYDSFQILLKACKRLSAEIKVCKISVEELCDTANYHEELIKKVENEIPDQTANKIHDVFYQIYQQKKEQVNLEEVFDHLKNPNDLLNFNSISLIDESWFIKNSESDETKRLALIVQKQFEPYSSRTKGKKRSTHDSLLLQWVDAERKNGKAWLVTKDRSLPTVQVKNENQPIAITLDALIQWISPIASEYFPESDLSSVFASALKRQLLPTESFFKLEDFKVFAELELECKQLPAEDVENCVKYLKRNATSLDPSKAEDREKIHRKISAFFASPSRKFSQKIDNLVQENKKKDNEIAELKLSNLRQKAFAVIGVGLILFFSIGITYSVYLWPSDKQLTILQKINQLIPIHALFTALYFPFLGIILGKEKLDSIGLWPKKRFK